MKTHNYYFLPRLAVLSCLLIFVCADIKAQDKSTELDGKWYLEMEHNDLGSSRFTMDFESDAGQFEAYSRKGAIKDILGGWKSFLARTMTSSFKKGALLRIKNGIYQWRGDTLEFAGILSSAVGSYSISGHVAAGRLSATLGNKSGYKGTITGTNDVPPLPLQDYHTFFRKTVEQTKDKIYNKAILETKEWKEFEKRMDKVSARVENDIEMLFAFYYYGSKLPISHYMLMRPSGNGSDAEASYIRRAFLEEKNPSTAYLKITSFSGSAAEMDSIFDIIVKKGYGNLIVDLRNNPGGSVDAGMAFATRVADDTFYGGVFLTQKYYNIHKTLPTVAEYENFPHFTESNYDLLMEGIHNTEGMCLKVVPRAPVYNGKLFILTNGGTASTCEPIVYGLKLRKRATIFGTRSAGAMLAAETFSLPHGFTIFLPTADYYASDGLRIDKVGIPPDIDTGEGDALQYVMDNFIKP